ncbi:MAG: ferredoxin [Planctomycetes bacterium]|nr:ferredoxin [Planctomycetota bacterium]
MSNKPKKEAKELPARLEDIEDRWEDNAPGIYYVDKSCVYCGLSQILAPNNFAINDSEMHSYVMQQPNTPAEFEACEDARGQCPAQSIKRIGYS